jgi:hypothetical protein
MPPVPLSHAISVPSSEIAGSTAYALSAEASAVVSSPRCRT